MKKNVMMRVASALLVAVLMTTCAISGTFAKYTTNATGSDSARVAKWGVVITANGEMFTTSEDGATLGAQTVLSAGAVGGIEDVVAPGMKGNLISSTISGTPEVAVEVKYEASLTLTGWEVNSAYYCPLEITVGTDTFKGLDYSDAAAFEADVEAAIDAYTAKYVAGTNLSGAAAPVVSWTWAFEVAGNDANDTALGDAANPATVELEIVITVNQLND